MGNIEFVELFGGRNGVILYGANGYNPTAINVAEFFYNSSGSSPVGIIGQSSNVPPGLQGVNLGNLNVVSPNNTWVDVATATGTSLNIQTKDNSGSPYAQIYAANINTSAAIPLYLQWGGGNIVFSSTAGASLGNANSWGSNPITGTQKFTFGGYASNGEGNQLGWYTNSGFSGDVAQIRGDADNYGSAV